MNVQLATTRELVSKAIVDLRNLSKSMNTDAVLAAGLLKAIEYELQLVAKAGFTTGMEVTGQTMRLNPQKELILFRMVQEAINNIIKHAGATTIRVRISFTENRMELVLDDDGAGFDPSAFSTDMDSGAGLRNMKSRAALIGGQLDIQSIPQQGTSIIITLPTTT